MSLRFSPESSKTCYFCTLFILLSSTMFSVSHNYRWEIARLNCFCLSHKRCLIWVKFVKIPKQKFESQLNVVNPCSVLWQGTLFYPIKARVIWKLNHKKNKHQPNRIVETRRVQLNSTFYVTHFTWNNSRFKIINWLIYLGVFKTRNGEMTKWRNGKMAKWRNDEMAK